MNNILKLLEHNPALAALEKAEESLASLSLIEEALLLAAAYRRKPQNILVVKNNQYNAQRLYETLKSIMKDNVLIFKAEESLRIEAIAASPEMMADKIDTLNELTSADKHILITHPAGLLKHLPDPAYFRSRTLTVKVGQQLDIQALANDLLASGYQQVLRVDQPLTFAKRGGIIDVYSLNYEQPLRIEFFDDEIDSIRYFDVASQRTIATTAAVRIIPATDILFTGAQLEEITTRITDRLIEEKQQLSDEDYTELLTNIQQDLDYLHQHIRDNRLYRYYAFLNETASLAAYMADPLVIISSREEAEVNIHNFTEENVAYLQELYQDHRALMRFHVFQELNTALIGQRVYLIHQFTPVGGQVLSHIHELNVPAQPLDVKLRLIAEKTDIKAVLCLSEKGLKTIVERLMALDIPYRVMADDSPILPGLSLCMDDLTEGFELTDQGIIVYSDRELFDNKVKVGRYANKFREAEVLSSYLDLNIGDYIVHNLYGIGKYLGIVTKELDHVHKDFLKIVYRGDDVLLVPLEQFQLVRKFVSREGVTPRLNKLGTAEWAKTKETIKKDVDDIAERLIQLYASRENRIGYAYQPDNELQLTFEKEFEYELTKDQEQAVYEIKADMMSDKPMDRLLCGDVGFGKTEVAIRAAFKAVLEHKQVAFLCPTTILSHQHYETFIQRFRNYPINIALLNRFVIEGQQKMLVQQLKEGKIDILIGTHRILSKDIKYHDLGLLIIDEEQRFGVEHKEKIKEFKQSIDVLSLSATPIPRTLQMSLIGIRSLSQLNTPPNNRLPVLTYVIEKNRDIIREVIQRELVRNGQVFYLYNNVRDIYRIAMQIKQDLPEAKIAVAHGKMHRTEIEDVMYRFINNEYNVLICTTIIETGIDIPNANTMIIDNADHFGLSQLYQIKGRVGRSDRLAYAYLMYDQRKQLTEIAQKRLRSIKEFTELGSGYKIAMRDLTIRGAGDMLGAKQSGFIDTVGIDMYIEMLQEAINEKKGIVRPQPEATTRIPVKLDAYIPGQFTAADYEKITIYQRIDAAKSLSQLVGLEEEVRDMYGELPTPVQLLFEKKRLELMISEPRIKRFKEIKNGAEIVFSEQWSSKVDGIRLFEQVSRIGSDIELKYLKGSIIIKFNNKRDWLKEALAVLRIEA